MTAYWCRHCGIKKAASQFSPRPVPAGRRNDSRFRPVALLCLCCEWAQETKRIRKLAKVAI